MTNSTVQEFPAIRAHIQTEIEKFLPLLGNSKEKADKYMKQKLFALIDALEMLNEASNPDEYGRKVREMYQARKGSADSLHGILKVMNIKHRYP